MMRVFAGLNDRKIQTREDPLNPRYQRSILFIKFTAKV